jgi:F0F1-type ATP synthase gamma subunit
LNNGEDYSKLKQMVKENVKAILSENKQVISISFTVLIHTLKSDPQMVKLIQNMPSANDSEQYKDNDINVTKYLEYNRDELSDFAEKNYENLVEALTNNAIDNGVASCSSNPVSSSTQSSSTFPNLSNQSDT